MLRICYLLLILAGINPFTSCRTVTEDAKKADYLLTRINSVNTDIDKFGDPFDAYNQNLSQEFAANGRTPLQKQQIDSFTLLFRNYIRAIDMGIKKLKTFNELDTTFKVVNVNLLFQKHQLRTWNKMGAQFLKMYATGWDNLSAEEQNAFVIFVNELKDDQTQTHILSDIVTRVSQQFSRKYGFNYELIRQKYRPNK